MMSSISFLSLLEVDVFGYMVEVVAWGVAVSVVAFVMALAAEGRGRHALNVVMRRDGGQRTLEQFREVPRGDGDWSMFAGLDTADVADREQTRRRVSFTDVS